VLGCELDRFATVNGMVIAVFAMMVVAVPVAAVPHLEQRADGDPAAKPDERDAR